MFIFLHVDELWVSFLKKIVTGGMRWDFIFVRSSEVGVFFFYSAYLSLHLILISKDFLNPL